MKIAVYFDFAYEIGGIETSSLNLAEEFDKLGHEVTFLFKNDGNINFLDKMSKYANVKKLEHDKTYYDLVIYERHSDTPDIEGDKKGIIINTNLTDWNDNTKVGQFDFYIAVSNECAEQFELVTGIKPVVIPNIVKIRNEDEPIKIKKGDINFVTVSRIDIKKGFEEMIDMVKMLESNQVNYYWYIIGSGGEAYEKRIRELYAPYKRVIFVGAKNNPYPYIKQSDTSVLLSKSESQCLGGLIEPLAMGKRTITGDFKTAHEYGSNLIIKDNNYTLEDIIKKEKGKLEYPDVMELWKPILKPREKKNYKYGIIIPNYNNEEWLEKCLNSALNQTYKNFKIYFIDDMSTDNSVKIAKTLLKEHKIFVNEYKRFNGGSRNIGILEAKKDKTDYLVFLDSDDWFKDEHVLNDINNKLRNEDVMTLGFELWDGNKITYTQMASWKDKFQLFQANHGVCCAVWNKVIKTEIAPLFQWDTLMEDRVYHYKVINRATACTNFERITHTWNKANANSITTNKGQDYGKQIKWDNCAYRHIADQLDLLMELEEPYRSFIDMKTKQCQDNVRRGIYQQL